MISVKCQACGAEYKVPPSMAGRRTACTCGADLSIPLPQDERSAVDPKKLQSAQWYVNTDGETRGPISYEEVRALVARGQLRAEHRVYAEPLGDWKQAGEVDALRPGGGEEADRWFVSRRGERYGPYDTERMQEMIREGRLGPKTKAWSPVLGEWKTLRSIGRFSETLKEAEAGQAVEEMWYYTRGGRRHGPMSLEGIIEAVREGRVRPADHVWSNRLDGWVEAREVSELSEALQAGAGERRGEIWYYRHEGETGGPVDLHSLRDLVERRELSPGDTVFNKELGEWKRVSQVPELQDAVAAARSGVGRARRRTGDWFYIQEGNERGPVSERFLAQRLSSGRLSPDTRVFGPGADQWRRARSVPELADYLPEEARGGPTVDETPTGVVEGIPQTGVSLFWKAAGLATVGLLVVGLAVVLYVSSRPAEVEGGGPEVTFRVPDDPEKMILAWLEIFLQDTADLPDVEVRAREQRLARFYSGRHMDLYPADVRFRLQRAMREAGGEGGDALSVERTDREIVRAEDERNFCYHVPFRRGEVTVRKAYLQQGMMMRRRKVFGGRSFRPVRVYRILVGGQSPHPSAYVLLMRRPEEDAPTGGEEASPWVIVSMGRAAHVGAQVGERRARYLTGYKAPSMRESDCLLQVGIERRPGTRGSEWEGYGQLMSVASGLVAAPVVERRAEVARRGMEEDLLLVFARAAASQDREDVEETYGAAGQTEEITIPSPQVRTMEAVDGAGERLYSRVTAHFYGDFGLGIDPVSGDVIGFVFRDGG